MADAERKLAMIERTVEIEQKIGKEPTLLDLFKGTDLRRTIIICLMYASQNLAGNLIANQATYFFEREWNIFCFSEFLRRRMLIDRRGGHVY